MTDRAVSTTLGYVLTLSIAALLVGGLLSAGAGFVTTQRDVVIREEMSVVGQQLSANVEQADRLVNASNASVGGSPVVQVNQTFPETVARSQYDIRLNNQTDQLILSSTDPEQTIVVNVTTSTKLGNSTARGGEITVRYAGNKLVIDNV
ncbi:DUF7266 family protein [Salinibaculum rarum]|uniref:DUF7266 family protein n=1 Tax=Salinibaculum rarum TaxID=3058903 RepID=UPI00265FC5E5|nr:hypothetical protein [Salinibaculum sp. KK48]